jgi:hypothetical protein
MELVTVAIQRYLLTYYSFIPRNGRRRAVVATEVSQSVLIRVTVAESHERLELSVPESRRSPCKPNTHRQVRDKKSN